MRRHAWRNPVDKLGVINLALLKTALPLATSLDECDWNASYIFDIMAEQVLRAHSWGFAQRFAQFARASTAPSFGYANSYVMPADCLKVLSVWAVSDVRAPKSEFRTSGRNVFTHAAPCNAAYVARDLEPENWPPDFTDAVATRIAMEIAGLSAEKMALVPQLMQLYQYSLAQAQASDSREERARVPYNDIFTGARESGGGRSY